MILSRLFSPEPWKAARPGASPTSAVAEATGAIFMKSLRFMVNEPPVIAGWFAQNCAIPGAYCTRILIRTYRGTGKLNNARIGAACKVFLQAETPRAP